MREELSQALVCRCGGVLGGWLRGGKAGELHSLKQRHTEPLAAPLRAVNHHEAKTKARQGTVTVSAALQGGFCFSRGIFGARNCFYRRVLILFSCSP